MKASPVLVWGTRADPPTRVVVDALRRMGTDVVMVDAADYGSTHVELAVDGAVAGTLRTRDRMIDLEGAMSCLVRPPDFRRSSAYRGRDAKDPAWLHAMAVEDVLLTWIELTACLVVNRPSDMASNGSKPYQAGLIREAGFSTPETLLTTDPDAVREFWRAHGQVIYKSLSGTRSIVRRLDAKEHDARLANVASCPTQFQQYIGGSDWRVHVVGERVFACEVTSDADDYRYAHQQGRKVDVVARTLDEETAARCVALARTCGLAFAGIDLRRTASGDWCCFEVNPSPGFTYYESLTGAPIGQAVAELLARR